MDMAKKKRQGGRPSRHEEGPLRKNRTFRIRARLDEQLEEAAAKAGRSTSEEIEHRLEISFSDERQSAHMFGSDVGADILRTLRAAMILEGVTPDWDGDLAKAERFRTVANAVIAAFLKLSTVDLPPPERRSEDMQTAKELLLRYSPRHVELPAEVMFSDLEPPDFGEASAEGEKRPTTSKQVGT
jgi:hypothetical protein